MCFGDKKMCEVCEKCGKPAKKNYQIMWVEWNYNPMTEDYSRNALVLYDMGSEYSIFLCSECGEKWKSGKIEL